MSDFRVNRALFGSLLAVLSLAGVPAHAGIEKSVDEIKHALGWDTLSMTTVDKDASGRPTLERNNDLINRVKRETTWFSDGNKASETVTVVSKSSKRTLYSGKKTWNDEGKLLSSSVEDDTYNRHGKQTWGLISERQFVEGRLSQDLQRRYSVPQDGWRDTFRQDITYFDDGDMKERDSTQPISGEKSREFWGPKALGLGRKVKTENWNPTKAVWE